MTVILSIHTISIRTMALSQCAIPAAALIALSGCAVMTTNTTYTSQSTQDGSDLPHHAESITLTISAAASLQNALGELQILFDQTHPHIQIFYNWGGSGTLQRQIEQGAPTDLFFSASQRQMNELNQKGLVIPTSQQLLLGNRLVLVTPSDSKIRRFQDLLTQENRNIAVGEFETVPVGEYAKATLVSQQLLKSLQPQFVFFNNVRGVLAAVESGHAEAGLVYETDAKLSEKVRIAAIAPPSTHPPIQYPIAILQRSPQPEAAQQYIDFLSTPEAIAVFQRFGFKSSTTATVGR